MEHKLTKSLKASLEAVSGLPCHLVKDPSGGYVLAVQTKPPAKFPAWHLYSPDQVAKAIQGFSHA